MLTSVSGDTNIYIYPGYEFGVIDGIITNFHLPKSSLLLLVSDFAGQKEIIHAYEYAVKNKYRFYSYGDGMVIL
jgi:S-adenosylmethionine:tRNA ribosyltransferase-isomerase